MLSLQELKPYYPEYLQGYDRFIIREYLQFKILEILFESPYANKLAFLGGTCLRIVHNNNRFSEDLDFDNFDLSTDDFNGVTKIVKTELERIGYEVEMRNVKKGAYHCYIRFPEILFKEGLTNHKEEKILRAESLIKEKVINMIPLKVKKVGMVTTGNEIFYGRIKDKFKEVMLPKIEKYGAKLIGQTIVPDDMNEITKAINDHIDSGAELIICTGGMSVDPSDITPNAIMNTGSEIITYGMPILTGSMTLIAYKNDVSIVGFPAGVLFSDKSSADVILHRLMCKDKITREEVAMYGNGGYL